jgi:hypothetical protein
MSELDDFGQILMRGIRDRVIRELFSQLDAGTDGPIPNQLVKQISASADDKAVRHAIIDAVDNAIAGFLFFLHGSVSGMDVKFSVFGPNGTDLASMSDGIHTEPFGSKGWIEKYSEFPEDLAGPR